MKNMNKNILILIAGGTGAGKTTVTNEILEEMPEDVTVINQDDYYKSFDELSFEERKKINFDHPDAVDMLPKPADSFYCFPSCNTREPEMHRDSPW